MEPVQEGGVAVYVSEPLEQPYPTEPLVLSLENATVITYDPAWARGTWFDLDLAHIYTYDLLIIAESC